MPALFDSVAPTDPLEFRENDGLDYQRVTEFLGYTNNDLSKIAGVAKNSVRFDDRMPEVVRERIEEIANICSLVAEFFDGNARKTALWFRTSNPLLGDVSPRDMIRLGRYDRLRKFVMEAMGANVQEETPQA